MSISARLTKLEFKQRPTSPDQEAAKAFWDKHLTLLSDAELDRLEEIFLKYASEDPSKNDRRLPDVIVGITDEERADMKAIWVTMGLNPDEWS